MHQGEIQFGMESLGEWLIFWKIHCMKQLPRQSYIKRKEKKFSQV